MEKHMIHKAEILCVGTELLLGDIVNTNAAFLSRKLASLGIGVYHQSVVGDNPERLEKALAEALSRAELVITSGGLGPTYDDLTKETVAKHFGRRMVTDKSVLSEIERYFALRHGNLCKMTANNRKQAEVPEGARVIHNPNGTAPGIIIEGEDGKTVVMLPGPPRELEPMMENSVIPYLESRRDVVFFSRNVHIMGMGESAIEDVLRDMMVTCENPTLAPYAKDGECRLRVTASAENREQAAAMCDALIEEIRKTEVGEFIYGIDAESVEKVLIERLLERGMTIATAESCTGGLVAKRITDIPGASAVLLGGIVSYTEAAKMSLLGVKRETLECYSAVSEMTAREMAEGVRARLGSDIGISTTGYAGPGGGTADDPVGTVYVGISDAGGTRVTRFSFSGMRSRDYTRTLAAGRALLSALESVLRV